MFDRWRAEKLHAQGLKLEAAGHLAEAEAAYRRALEIEPDRAETLFNLGLLCKYQARWPESFQFNLRAHAADPHDEAACWNLGIAATALGDWVTARRAWLDYGLSIPDGEGPIQMDLGLVPVRLNPAGDAEVVWARRIDPARAVVRSVPFPQSGFACGDVVLHDGAPNGYRQLNGREVPVFDVLALTEPSGLSTFEVIVEAPDGLQELEALCESAGVGYEDWTANVRWLCKACSEGRPHAQHDSELPRPGGSQRRLGLAAPAAAVVSRILSEWEREPGRRVVSATCMLRRTST